MAKINIIYGEKGSGKTKKMVDSANRSVEEAKGVVVYIDKDNSRIHDLEHTIKLIDASEYKVDSEETFIAFLKGVLAGNYDIEKVFVDSMARIVRKDIKEISGIMTELEMLSNMFMVEFTLSISYARENLPVFISKFAE